MDYKKLYEEQTKQLGGDLPKEDYGGQPTQSTPQKNKEFQDYNRLINKERKYQLSQKKFNEKNPDYRKKYYEKHKVKKKAERAKYYTENQDEIVANSKKHYDGIKHIRWTCDCCNCNIKLVSKHMHLKTKKHLENKSD